MLILQKIKETYTGLLKKKTFKSFAAVSISSFALKPVGFLREFFIAKFLTPEYYGILKSLEMIQMLNKFGSLGFNATASREAGHLYGESQYEQVPCITGVIAAAFVICFVSKWKLNAV